MYRFIRTVVARNGVSVPAALHWASEVSSYLNKTYALNMSFGAELFGDPKIHWHFDIDSLDKIGAVNAKLMQDQAYIGMLEKAKVLFLEGGIKDTVVRMMG